MTAAAKIASARTMLTEAARPASGLAALGAASFAAIAAVLMAGVVVLGPGVQIDESVQID